VLGVARARAVVLGHHGGGGPMPSYSDRQFQKDLADFDRIRNRSAGVGGGGKGGTKGPAESDAASSWSCHECGYYNFGSRRRCRHCSTTRPANSATTPLSPQPGGKGTGGGGKGGGKTGGHKREGKNTSSSGGGGGYAKLLAQYKALEEQNKALALKASEAAKGNEGEEDDPELLEDDAEDDPQAAADLENLQALQKLYDTTLVSLGAEDPSARALRQRLDTARAKQRAAKPVLHQVQAAQRKAARHERHLETAKGRLAELEQKKKDLEKEVAEQAAKVTMCAEEVDKCRTELGELLERAKVEQGTAAQVPPAGAAIGSSSNANGGIQGAAAAWNAAKAAIQAQLASLPADSSQDLRQAILAQYDAMESVLNKLPTSSSSSSPPAAQPADPKQEQHPQPPQPSGGGGDGANGTATAAHEANAGSRGGGDNEMLDIDDATIVRLAEILTDNGGAVAGDGDDADGDGDGGDAEGGGSRKSRKVLDSRVAAARQFLEGKVPLRKPHLKKPGK
jgi:hypothetical protein